MISNANTIRALCIERKKTLPQIIGLVEVRHDHAELEGRRHRASY